MHPIMKSMAAAATHIEALETILRLDSEALINQDNNRGDQLIEEYCFGLNRLIVSFWFDPRGKSSHDDLLRLDIGFGNGKEIQARLCFVCTVSADTWDLHIERNSVVDLGPHNQLMFLCNMLRMQTEEPVYSLTTDDVVPMLESAVAYLRQVELGVNNHER